jgi:hypothetical protein
MSLFHLLTKISKAIRIIIETTSFKQEE